MLRAKIFMNLKLKRAKNVARMKPGNRRGHRSRSAKHAGLDNDYAEVVQINALKII